MCACLWHRCARVHMWRSEDNLWELVLSLHVGSRDWILGPAQTSLSAVPSCLTIIFLGLPCSSKTHLESKNIRLLSCSVPSTVLAPCRLLDKVALLPAWVFPLLTELWSFGSPTGLEMKFTWSGVLGLKNLMNCRSTLLRTRDHSYKPWINFYELGPKSLSKMQLIFHKWFQPLFNSTSLWCVIFR